MAVMGSLLVLHDRRNPVTSEHLGQIARLADVEDDDRNIVVAAQSDGGGVHHLEVVAEHLAVAQMVVARGAFVGLRVGGVDASPRVPLNKASQPISAARSAAAVSVVK